MSLPKINDFIFLSNSLFFNLIGELTPWQALVDLEDLIGKLLVKLDPKEYVINNKQAIHKTAVI